MQGHDLLAIDPLQGEVAGVQSQRPEPNGGGAGVDPAERGLERLAGFLAQGEAQGSRGFQLAEVGAEDLLGVLEGVHAFAIEGLGRLQAIHVAGVGDTGVGGLGQFQPCLSLFQCLGGVVIDPIHMPFVDGAAQVLELLGGQRAAQALGDQVGGTIDAEHVHRAAID